LLLNKLIYALPGRFNKVIYRAILSYYSQTRSINFRGLSLTLLPSVFHPKLYLTTETLLDYLLTLDMAGKAVLELGCGSGAISLYLAKHRDIEMHASDINPHAISGLMENATNLQVKVDTYQSDLFDDIPDIQLDTVIINPPFFDNVIESVDQYAFNTGDDFQYFKKLNSQLLSRKEQLGVIYMILTDKCNLDKILSHFDESHYEITVVKDIKSLGEIHFIYRIILL